MATNPTLQDFEEKFDEFQVLDKEIATIESFAQIGAVSLCTDSLKYALKNEVSQWRAMYHPSAPLPTPSLSGSFYLLHFVD